LGFNSVSILSHAETADLLGVGAVGIKNGILIGEDFCPIAPTVFGPQALSICRRMSYSLGRFALRHPGVD
jgi:hypothetical protein